MPRQTLISIARRTGFSVSTVSRVLSGQAAKYRISPEPAEFIAREANGLASCTSGSRAAPMACGSWRSRRSPL